METDWSVACGAGDPMVVIPWSDATGLLVYLDLRSLPAAVREIPLATQYPCLATALRCWNQKNSPVFTVKCDVWSYPADLFDADDLPGFAFAHGSYIDLLSSDSKNFSSFAASEQQLRVWNAWVQALPLPECRCEWTLRPARILPAAAGSANSLPQDGFATTLYVWGYGSTPQAATSAWAGALDILIEPVLLLSRS